MQPSEEAGNVGDPFRIQVLAFAKRRAFDRFGHENSVLGIEDSRADTLGRRLPRAHGFVAAPDTVIGKIPGDPGKVGLARGDDAKILIRVPLRDGPNLRRLRPYIEGTENLLSVHGTRLAVFPLVKRRERHQVVPKLASIATVLKGKSPSIG